MKIVWYNGDDWKGAGETMKKVIPVFVAIVLIFTIIAISLGMKLVEKYSYSKEEEYNFHLEYKLLECNYFLQPNRNPLLRLYSIYKSYVYGFLNPETGGIIHVQYSGILDYVFYRRFSLLRN